MISKQNLIVFLLLAFNINLFGQYHSSKIEVRFDLNQAELIPQTLKTLDSLLLVLKKYSDFSIELNGHCDRLGTVEINSPLSLNRAGKIAAYFKSKGVNPNIITAYGYGNENPKYDLPLDSLNRRVEIIVSVNQLISNKTTKSKETNKAQTENVSLEQNVKNTNVGGKFIVKAMEFYPGQSEPLPSAIEAMKELSSVLIKQPSVCIEIQGHICCSSNDDGNLSEKRAKVVFNYLLNNGIDSTRLSYRGFGHTRPLNNESTPSLAQMNRRVEIMITKK